ncbi:MAG: hypothetical protein J6I89_04995 [Oscillospiraceae bacterium]|nr:hypothetical protein [Oscillospiraceae bacterium]
MGKIRFLLSALLCMVLLTACGGGDVSEVGRHIGVCERFSRQDVADAMDEVERFFRREYDGCKLLRLEYDEEKTQKEAYAWSENYGAEAIVLKSDFYVDDSGRSVTLEPDETYRNYEWILTKTAFGWELRTWGYG